MRVSTRFWEDNRILTQRGLSELATREMRLPAFEAQADRDEGIFGDHLRRFLVSLAARAGTVRRDAGRPERNSRARRSESFYRLRSAGLLVGDLDPRRRARAP